MICIYESNCTDFSGNGLGVLAPFSCSVTETLNGEYELVMEHPLDRNGKWERIVEGRILRAPVPAAITPRIEQISQQYQDSFYDVQIYKITTKSGNLRLRSGTGTNYKILSSYKKGSEVIVVEKTTSSWYEVTAPDGKHGYMASEYLTFVRTEKQSIRKNVGFKNQVLESRQLRDQPFRIYRVVPDLTKVTVYARHIFYDLLDNMLQKVEPGNDEVGASAVQRIASGCLSAHDFTFYSDLSSTAEDVVWENINPVEALLGEDGVTGKYKAELTRDWFDVFLVDRVGNDTDVQIREKKNLTGISYDVDITNVTTRIMPTGENKDGEVLYLPELFLDSPYIGAYPAPKWIHLAVSEAKESDDDDEPKSIQQCYAEMRKAAQAEFDAGCDLPSATLTVDFISCENTVEYAQYAGLRSIFLGDAVQVISPRIGVSVSMRMTQYTYDCLLQKYASVTLGTVADTLEGSTISGRQLASGSITGGKIAMNAIGAGQLQNGSVGHLQIQMAAIETAHIQDAAISSAKIGEAAIQTGHIEDAAITQAKIADAAIGKAQIQEAAIGTAQIEHGAINSAHIGDGQIENAKIANGAITSAKIDDAAILAAHIKDGEIGTAKIADAAITNAQIAGAAIGTANIQDGAIVTAHILDGNITKAKIADLAVDSAKIADLAVTTAKIAQGAITNAQIENAAIDTAKIALGAITAALIQQGAVGTVQIADGSITDAKIVELTANKITAGTLSVERLIIRGSEQSLIYAINNMGELVSTQVDTIDGYVLTERTITADKIVAHSITAAEIASKTITANEIVTGTITGSEIAAGSIEGSNIKAGTLTTSHVSADFGKRLDLTSNEGIRQRVEKIYSDVDELLGYRLEIISTSDILSADIQNTILQARVWHGSQNVTDSIDASRFSWHRLSADSTADALWDSAHAGMKQITLTVRDVLYSATYTCELADEEE
nr:MAG TPA: Putative tail protein [Caudoviricetes sp.]